MRIKEISYKMIIDVLAAGKIEEKQRVIRVENEDLRFSWRHLSDLLKSNIVKSCRDNQK